MYVILSISKNYTTVKVVVDAAPRSSRGKYVIYILRVEYMIKYLR